MPFSESPPKEVTRSVRVAKWAWILGRLVIVIAISWFLWWAIQTGYEKRDRELKFEGKCDLLQGKVIGQACIRDRKVILWRIDQ